MMKDEPVLTGAAILSFAGILIALLTSFGVSVTPEQEKAILGAVAFLGPWIAAYFVRKHTSAFRG